jgi:formate dehydrogenase gamma subunit
LRREGAFVMLPAIYQAAMKRAVLPAMVLGFLTISGLPHVSGAEEGIPDETCMECHSDKNLTKKLEDSTEVSLFVDEKKLKASVHKETRCSECHQDLTDEHPDDEKIPQPVDCARCHENASRTFGTSVHGVAIKAGSDAAANCKDCHGNHEVLSPHLPASPLHFTRQIETCGECHTSEAEEVAASVHGKATAKGVREAPVCTDCHREHSIRALNGKAAYMSVGATCSRCHDSEPLSTKFGMPADRVQTFFESYHGLAIQSGETNAANCASCHGYHKILPSTDPDSSIHKRNLVETCGKCHPGAGENFALGEVHLNGGSTGSVGATVNHWVRVVYLWLIAIVIGGMVLHNLMSWLRALKSWYHARGETVVRMNLHQRIQHFVLLSSFILLALSGFALKFPDSWLAWLFGSDEAIRRWIHRAAGIVMLGASLWHAIYIVTTRDGRKLVKDFCPRWQDARDLGSNLLYFVGKNRQHPQFSRFGYAEKLEYWAVIWGTLIMGVTGLMIWMKIDVTRYLPRWAVDVATTIHYYEAILACLAIVVWHFYHVLIAPGTYPMNFAWWDGKVSRKWYEEEHPLDVPPEENRDEEGKEHPSSSDKSSGGNSGFFNH